MKWPVSMHSCKPSSSGVGENALDLVLELDVAAAVRMQHRRETVLDSDGRRLTDPRQQHLVVVAFEASCRGTAPGGRTTFVADHVDHHEESSAERGDPLARLLGGVVDVFVTIAIVHRFEDVRTGDAESTRSELDAHPIVVVGKVSGRAELAQAIAGLADLVEHLLPRWRAGLVGQIDAPRNWPVCNFDGHVGPSRVD